MERKAWAQKLPLRGVLTVALMLLVIAIVIVGALKWHSPSVVGTDNLLANRTPMRAVEVVRPRVLTDGVRAEDGGSWDSHLTARFRTYGAYVQYDLGQPTPIVAGFLQGDNNDEYVVSVSNDGEKFVTVWAAPPHRDPGLQPRSSDQLQGSGRYVRISAGRGDGSYALTEVQLFSVRPAVFPPWLEQKRGLPPGEPVRSSVLLFGLALAFLLFATWRRAPTVWTGLCVLLPMLAGCDLYFSLKQSWPVAPHEVSFVRAVAAAVAGLAILREFVGRVRFGASRVAVFAALGVAAAMALAAFFNLGRGQFWDHQRHKPGFVHNYDLRIYYPLAKYFEELRFDGVYKASVAAYVDDVPDTKLDSLGHIELRDLTTHDVKRVARVKGEIGDVKRRFSPQRWQQFKRDMRYFRQTMGPADYLGSMTDRAAQASPVWLLFARAFFANLDARYGTLLATALLDPLLLLCLFVVVGVTFGIRTMLVSAVVFGATDFYMFGSNWAGATLRHDWLAYLGLGVCALKGKKWVLGGALLGLATSLRGFPVVALVGLAVPALWWLGRYFRQQRKAPLLRTLVEEQRPVLTALLGALVCCFALFLLSSFMFSFGAWSTWLTKLSLLEKEAHVNHIGLRALLAGFEGMEASVLRGRWPLALVALVVGVMAVVAACRNQRPDRAALLGLLLIPLLFNPANHHVHFVFLLPLLVVEAGRRAAATEARPPVTWLDAGIWWLLLGVCVAQYWTVQGGDVGLHFKQATAILFGAMAVLLALVLRRDFVPVGGEAAGEAPLATREAAALAETAAPAERAAPLPAPAKPTAETSSEQAAQGAPSALPVPTPSVFPPEPEPLPGVASGALPASPTRFEAEEAAKRDKHEPGDDSETS